MLRRDYHSDATSRVGRWGCGVVYPELVVYGVVLTLQSH